MVNRYQSLPKSFCKAALKILCYKWKAQQSSLTALKVLLEEDCDKSDEKKCFTFVVNTSYPTQMCYKFLYVL